MGWAHNNGLINNTILDNEVGIALSRDYGYGESNNNQIIGNFIYNHTEGLVIMDSRENTISTNVIYDIKWTGMAIYNSTNNNFLNNSIVNAFSYGIEMDGSINNTVSNNDFIDDNYCSVGSQASDDAAIWIF